MARLHFETEAELFAHKAWEKLKLELPVDLGRVARSLGIEVYEREFTEDIDGFYVHVMGVPPVIAINKSYVKPLARRRFTLAHEIGHHLFASRAVASERLCFFDSVKTSRNMTERACDRFAALLLMPEKLIREHYLELQHNPGQRIAIIADRFGVSSMAVRRRFRELSLPVNAPRERR